MSYLRFLSAKKRRRSEETTHGRLDLLVSGIGLFHFMWEIMKIIFRCWWGNSATEGSLGQLRDMFSQNYVDMDAKKFTYCDEFLQSCIDVILLLAFNNWNGRPLLEVPGIYFKVTMDKFTKEFVFAEHKDANCQFFSSFLQVAAVYEEVEISSLFQFLLFFSC